ncbi:hypothetical protein HGB24_00770 [Candidatus Saccharibacteria bacterium]|nr:hypothetical protein [Candidatus Saccharibacteria bacterium]
MIEINLIPNVKQELIKAQRIRTKVIASSILVGVISISVVTLLAVYIFGAQSLRGYLADKDIDTYSAKLKAVPDLSKMLTIQNQITKLKALNDNKKIDSRLFDLLAAIISPIPNDIRYSSLSIDSDQKTISIEAQSVNSAGAYATAEIFKKTIEVAQVKYTDTDGKDQQVNVASNVSTSNVSYGEDASGQKVLRFTISFNYNDALFSPSSKDASVVIVYSDGGDFTDSRLGVPSTIFTSRASDITEGDQ